MHCPRCGAENQAGNRFCVSCGSALSGASTPSASPRERFTRLIGTTRRARLLSAATVLAGVVAIVAFVALKPDEGGATPEDSFTRAADRACVREKSRVAALERQTLQGRQDTATFASSLVTVIAEWRLAVQALPVTVADAEAARSLDSALLDVLIRAGALARVARAGSPAEVATEAQEVDEASAEVDRQIGQLGLDQCADVEA
jgi:hypothetical protein